MSSRSSRREFLRTTAVTGLGVWAAQSAWADDAQSPNDRIRFACIGVGGKGESDTRDAANAGEVVAICDIDDDTLDKAAQKYPKARKFNDFRKMLEEMDKSIDAVTVSTPDHCHAVAAGMAMQMGKHCFCQKPLTRSIWEARRLAEIAREKKVASMMGNQGTAQAGLRRMAAMVRAGVIGPVKEVHVWTNRATNFWLQGEGRPAAATPPSTVHWDLWLGPAPERPYAAPEKRGRDQYGYHPFAWRGWWDFGSGALGDMACHTANLPFMALDLRNPTSVVAETSPNNHDSYPLWSIIRFDFPANDRRPGLTFTWYDGGKLPPAELLDGKTPSSSGSLMIGEKGKVYTPDDYGERGQLLGDVQPIEVEFTPSPGHFQEWVRAIKGGEQAMSNFPNYAGPLTETILLGNLAVYAGGKKIEWDAQGLKATNAPEVARIIRPEYRGGYTL